jgi:hypothetical protein
VTCSIFISEYLHFVSGKNLTLSYCAANSTEQPGGNFALRDFKGVFENLCLTVSVVRPPISQ